MNTISFCAKHSRNMQRECKHFLIQNTYTWLSLTFFNPWLTSSVSSFQTLMPSFLFSSCATLTLLARTCRRVCISSSTWNETIIFCLRPFSFLKHILLLIQHSKFPSVSLALPKTSHEVHLPYYLMLVIKSQSNEAKRLLLRQESKYSNRNKGLHNAVEHSFLNISNKRLQISTAHNRLYSFIDFIRLRGIVWNFTVSTERNIPELKVFRSYCSEPS